MKREALAASLVLTMGALGLAGCTSPAGTGKTELRILVNSNPASNDFLSDVLIPAFEEAHPDVDVTLDTAETDGYWGVVKTRLAAKAVDVVWGWGGELPPDYTEGASLSDFQALAEAGAFVEQSDQDYVDRWLPEAVEGSTIGGKVYALPSGANIVNGIYYNKDIFAEHGLEIPTTWSEFETVNETLTSAGVQPLGLGGKDIWPAGLLMLGLVQSIYPDMEGLNHGLWDGSDKLTDADSVELLDRLKQIFAWTEPTFAGIAYSDVTARFTSEAVAMIPDGTWAEPGIAAANPKFEYGYFPLPGSDVAGDTRFGSKFENGFAVSSASSEDVQQAAFDLIDTFSQPDTYSEFIKAVGFVPVLTGTPVADNPFLASISDGIENMGREWELYFFYNQNGPAGTQYPWDYSKIAPLGSETDMNKLAEELQTAWEAGVNG